MFRASGLVLRVYGTGSRVQGLGFWVLFERTSKGSLAWGRGFRNILRIQADDSKPLRLKRVGRLVGCAFDFCIGRGNHVSDHYHRAAIPATALLMRVWLHYSYSPYYYCQASLSTASTMYGSTRLLPLFFPAPSYDHSR